MIMVKQILTDSVPHVLDLGPDGLRASLPSGIDLGMGAGWPPAGRLSAAACRLNGDLRKVIGERITTDRKGRGHRHGPRITASGFKKYSSFIKTLLIFSQALFSRAVDGGLNGAGRCQAPGQV